MMPPTVVNTIIVGGGHAGVNLACLLELQQEKNMGVGVSRPDYLILEKENTLLSKWRDQRWDNFQMNTPIIFCRLYGQKETEASVSGKVRDDWLLDRPLEDDLAAWDAHIEALNIMDHAKLQSKVVSVEPQSDGSFETIVVDVSTSNVETPSTSTAATRHSYKSKNVVVCNGYCDHNIVPKHLSDALPTSVKQHITGGFLYKDLQPGNILIVGSSQSGVQLGQLLLEHNASEEQRRQIYLSCSSAGGCPRSYRGKDIYYWLDKMKFLYIPREALAGMPPEKATSLRYGGSGSPVTGPHRAISPFSLERQGVMLTGRLTDVVDQRTIKFKNDRGPSLRAAKAGHDKIVNMIHDFVSKNLEGEGDNPTEEVEQFDPFVPEPEWEITNESLLSDENTGPLSLDLEQSNITNLLWAVGWASNFDWLKIDMSPDTNKEFDAKTNLPAQIISERYPGLFFAGYPWVGTIQSMNIANMDYDSQIIADHLRT